MINAKGADYDFSYGYDEDEWTLLYENADGTMLRTQSAGGFVGSYLDLHVVKGQF